MYMYVQASDHQQHITLLCSTSPYKPQERAGLIVESLRSHLATPTDSADTSLTSQEEEREEPVEKPHVTDSAVLKVHVCNKYISLQLHTFKCSLLQVAPDLCVLVEQQPPSDPSCS